MGFERKLIRDAKFKQAKLDKTKGRRGALNRERQSADQCGLARRNDLLPELQVRQMPIEPRCTEAPKVSPPSDFQLLRPGCAAVSVKRRV